MESRWFPQGRDPQMNGVPQYVSLEKGPIRWLAGSLVLQATRSRSHLIPMVIEATALKTNISRFNMMANGVSFQQR